MKKHLNIMVSGKVQGVFYRATAVETARKLGIKGFARNEPDGTVYMEAEGAEDALNAFIVWCHTGPGQALVETVKTEEGALKHYENFEIRYR